MVINVKCIDGRYDIWSTVTSVLDVRFRLNSEGTNTKHDKVTPNKIAICRLSIRAMKMLDTMAKAIAQLYRVINER